MAPDRSELKHLSNLYESAPVETIRRYCSELFQDSRLGQEKILAVDEFCLQLLYTDPKTAAGLAKERLERFPDFSVGLPLCCLAGCYAQLGDRVEVIQYCERGLKLEIPRRAKLNLLSILRKYRDIGSFLRPIFEGFDVSTDGVDMLGKMHELAVTNGDLVQAEKIVALIRKCYGNGQVELAREGPRNNLFWCDHEPTNIKVTQAAIARHHGTFSTEAPARTKVGRRKSEEKMTIGYLSADFRDHPTAYLMLGAWRHHDRDRFNIVFFDVGWDDKSEVRLELESFCDELVSLSGFSDKYAAQVIRDAAVDVLIELNGPTHSNRLGILKYRPAPVSIGYLGWPGSYGGDVVDCVIGDKYVWPDDAESKIPERIIRLGGTYQINDHKSYPSFGDKGCNPGLNPGEGSLFSFGNMNNVNKFTLSCWDVWMHILKQCQHSRLVLLDPGKSAKENLKNLARRYSIDADRIQWLPRCSMMDHLSRIANIDLVIDSWPYGGHTTTSDALSVRVPVLTLAGSSFASRVSGSLVQAAGLGKTLIANSVAEYAEIACSFYDNPAQLEEVRSFMSRNLSSCSLFDSKGRTRELEQVIEGLVRG